MHSMCAWRSQREGGKCRAGEKREETREKFGQRKASVQLKAVGTSENWMIKKIYEEAQEGSGAAYCCCFILICWCVCGCVVVPTIPPPPPLRSRELQLDLSRGVLDPSGCPAAALHSWSQTREFTARYAEADQCTSVVCLFFLAEFAPIFLICLHVSMTS